MLLHRCTEKHFEFKEKINLQANIDDLKLKMQEKNVK